MFSYSRLAVSLYVVLAVTGWFNPSFGETNAPSRIGAALENITAVVRSGRVGYATFWDHNSYVQCRRMQDRDWRCEAAGTLLQPSLRRILTPERIGRLEALGWRLNPNFGNYARTLRATMPASDVAKEIWHALIDAYDAKIEDLEVATDWIADVPCPPRNGPSQNLAGSVNDAPAMRATALRTCAYAAAGKTEIRRSASSAVELIALQGSMTTAEIQRLRVNIGRRVFVIFDAGIGYIQCKPQQTPPAIYCEAQSSESWPALAAVLTPERMERLRAAGFADPGRTPNYWKTYPADRFNDQAIADELLTLLYEVYGYNGTAKLKVKTE